MARQQLLMGCQLVWFVLSFLEQFLQLPRGSQYNKVSTSTGDQTFDNICFGSRASEGRGSLGDGLKKLEPFHLGKKRFQEHMAAANLQRATVEQRCTLTSPTPNQT